MLVPERLYDLVPVRSVGPYSRTYPAALGTGEQSGVGTGRRRQPSTDHRSYLLDERYPLARLPFVPLSMSPPGPGVVCRAASR
jgi:hypothetical protein